MAKINLNTSTVKKRRKSVKDKEKNNNSKTDFKHKHHQARKKRLLRTPMRVKCPKRKGRVRFPSFLERCKVMSETTLINISDDSCITIPDDDPKVVMTPAQPPKRSAEDGGISLIVIPDEQTPQSSSDKGDNTNDFNKENKLEIIPASENYCRPLTNNVSTRDFLPLSVKKKKMRKENDLEKPSSSQNEPDDVVYISDSDEPFPTSRRTTRWHSTLSDVTSADETVITKTVASPKRPRKHLFCEVLKGSTPKLTKGFPNGIELSPIPVSSAQTKRTKQAKKLRKKKKRNDEIIDKSSLEKLSELNKVLTAIPDLPNILKKLEGKSKNGASSSNVTLDDSDCINFDKTYSSSGQFISDNIYHVKKIKRVGLRPIVIDGSNIAMGHSNGRLFSVKGLKICIDYFTNRGHKVYAFVPSYRLKRTQSSDQNLLMDLVKKELVFCTASRDVLGHKICSYDDRILVQVAAAMDAVIVSGDNYRDLIKEEHRLIPVIKNNLLMPTWVGDMLIFPDDPLGRAGPNLKKFLRY